MILLAKEIVDEPSHLAVMDITARRNAYCRQIDSFYREVVVPSFSESPMSLVFIRAPWIEEAKSSIEIIRRLDGNIVTARQENMLVTSFHPELTDNSAIIDFF